MAFLKIPNRRYIQILVGFYLAASFNKIKTNIMKLFKSILAVAVLALTIISCKKDNTAAPAAAVAATGSFTWKENGVAHTADSANYFVGGGITSIYAYEKRGTSSERFFEINLTTSAAGTFTYNLAGPNFFYYLAGTVGNSASAGSIIISNYDIANNKLTGTFTGAIIGARTLTEGVFTSIRKQ
jgi:hypothetical protein